jgi:uncharacterized protein YrzB (UPF0473 family)
MLFLHGCRTVWRKVMDIESIAFRDENGAEHMFYVEEQTRINGTDYLLVTDSEGDDGEAYILRDDSGDGDQEAAYIFVEDDEECAAVGKIFSEMLEDIDLF